jgi:antitoxin component YwqK of YwqJK toxin-antitoxin module
MKKIKNGKWKEFNKHAVLVSEGEYVNGLKHGIWREYYDDTGALLIEENYKNGIPHGQYRSFYPNGQLCGEGEFINGFREGYFRLYDEQGVNIKNLLFVNNMQINDNNEPARGIERAERTTAS